MFIALLPHRSGLHEYCPSQKLIHIEKLHGIELKLFTKETKRFTYPIVTAIIVQVRVPN